MHTEFYVSVIHTKQLGTTCVWNVNARSLKKSSLSRHINLAMGGARGGHEDALVGFCLNLRIGITIVDFILSVWSYLQCYVHVYLCLDFLRRVGVDHTSPYAEGARTFPMSLRRVGVNHEISYTG